MNSRGTHTSLRTLDMGGPGHHSVSGSSYCCWEVEVEGACPRRLLHLFLALLISEALLLHCPSSSPAWHRLSEVPRCTRGVEIAHPGSQFCARPSSAWALGAATSGKLAHAEIRACVHV